MVSATEPGQWVNMIRFDVVFSGVGQATLSGEKQTVDMPDYAEFAATLERCGSAHSPSEAHGFAVGLHLARVEMPHVTWELELYSDFDPADVLAGECRSLLDMLFTQVFAEDGDGFALLLPQDVVVDHRRLVALRDWCQGFLYGIGLAGESLTRQGSPQMQDLLRDIAEITRLEVDDVENSDENQSALIEIEEYLRVGVLLLRDEVHGRKATHVAD
jgi:hypothetical protein